MSKKPIFISVLVLAIVGGLIAYGNSSDLMGAFKPSPSTTVRPCITAHTTSINTALKEFEDSLDDLQAAVTFESLKSSGEETDYEALASELEASLEEGEVAYDSLVKVYSEIEAAEEALLSCI
jgi:hypothetical protein